MIGETKRKIGVFRTLLLVSRSLLAASLASLETEAKAAPISTFELATAATTHRNFFKGLFDAAFDGREGPYYSRSNRHLPQSRKYPGGAYEKFSSFASHPPATKHWLRPKNNNLISSW